MTSAAPSLLNAAAGTPPQRSATAELLQETLALTRRLFLQLARRPSTLVAGVLQPLIWLVLFGALFANAPEGVVIPTFMRQRDLHALMVNYLNLGQQ